MKRVKSKATNLKSNKLQLCGLMIGVVIYATPSVYFYTFENDYYKQQVQLHNGHPNNVYMCT